MAYKSLQAFGESVFLEKKSRFIGSALPVEKEEEALAFLERIRKEQPQATHHCYCYLIGASARVTRFSDDGEPSGTAGLPMLEVCLQKELTNLCCVVSRYFGGIKLGAAGLVRAYRRSVRESLDQARLVRYIPWQKVQFSLAYEHLGKLDYQRMGRAVEEVERVFTDCVTLVWWLPEEEVIRWHQELSALSAGQLTWQEGPCCFRPEPPQWERTEGGAE